MKNTETTFTMVLRSAEHDSRLPESARTLIDAFRQVNGEFGKWSSEVKSGTREGDLEEIVWGLVELEEEVCRTWERFDAAPGAATADAFASAVAKATEERLRRMRRSG